jgi:hypothetical protein
MAKIHAIDSDVIVHDGKQYRKVDRPVREGDAFIIPKESDIDYTAGKVYAITGIDCDGDPHFIDDVGDKYHLLSGEYYVLEPVAADLYALESELAAMKAKVAEMERQLAEVKKGAPEDRLKVGDYAKVVDADYWLLHGFKTGDIVQVTENPYGEDDHDYRIQSIVDPDKTGYAHKDRGFLVRVTDEEVAEAKRKLAEKENADKWVAIGRKPGEFKVGDIVKITKYQFGHAEGSIVEVTEAYGSFVKVSGIHRGTLCTFDADIDCIELVAPVESVVNLRATNAS